ncbi:hypothetical protein ACIPX0_25500 [Streptomyces sp. NPDC090075]|uniref:hypothetical protein n=1 Tax=unclassified Streptomyces TaxID=2593676 RepID=UPI0033F03E05
MQKIQLTYWWNGHEPGDVVEVDDPTARGALGVIARPVPEAEPDPEGEPDADAESEPRR